MDRKKAGILTFHDADNLGAVLQAYALKKTLETECGVSAEIIDYKCNKISATKFPSNPSNIKNLIKWFFLSIYYFIKRSGFEKFRKNFLGLNKRSFTKNDIKSVENDFDYFITGSDQVWNPLCTDSDCTYVLDFVSERRKKYSYSASIGNYEFNDFDREWINKIKDYSLISVRENHAANELRKNGIENISVNLDPVFLLSYKDWELVKSERIISQPYVLVYLVLPDVNVTKLALDYAKKHGLKLISNKKSIEFFIHNSPSDFLSWIYNAECVFTNSFHGTAFSFLFNKKLFSDVEMSDGSINQRVNDLLVLTESTILSDTKNPSFENAKINKELEHRKKESIDYLKEICKH